VRQRRSTYSLANKPKPLNPTPDRTNQRNSKHGKWSAKPVIISNTNSLNHGYRSLPHPTSPHQGEEQILELYL
jgi:hypothetical protein